MKKFTLLLAIISILFSISTVRPEENPSLKFFISGDETTVLNLYEMKNKLDSHTIIIKDPFYEKNKRYKAFLLKDVLNLAYGDKWKGDKYSDMSFHAKDGYEAVSDIGKLGKDGGYLVYRDMEYENWEPIGEKKADPSPFYIVWKGKDQLEQFGYPWPWQLESINLMLFREQYEELDPGDISEKSSVFEGFEIFKQRCVRCHSINRQGGKVGPDLNAPMNILEYRPSSIVKQYIKHPSKFRYTIMPDNPDLSEKQLESLVDYLWHLKNKKNSE